MIDAIVDVCNMPSLENEGIFTHFAVADEGIDGANFTKTQYERFMYAVEELEARGIKFDIKHCANSAALSDYKNYHMDMVRAGIVLYGLQPSAELRTPLELRPAMTLKSVVSHVKTLREGDSVSYGRTFVAKQDMKIATVPIGYADGYRRASSENGATLLIRGKRCPIVGRVCMDQLMVDVSELPLVCVGDEVTVFGCSPALTAAELAALNGTVAYEMICAVGVRVPRVYLRDGKVVCVRDNLIP
jgi:alanine racemase